MSEHIENIETPKYPDLSNPGFKVLGDTDAMPYGKHKGKLMKDVPSKDLMWLWDNDRLNKSVKNYMINNWERICLGAGRNPDIKRFPEGMRIDPVRNYRGRK